MNEKKEIIWEAPEFAYFEKSAKWYAILGIAFLLMIIFGWASRDFFFVVFLILSGIMIFYLGARKPENVKFELGEEGCKIGNSQTIYRYAEITGFAVLPKPRRNDILILKRKAIANPYLKVPLKRDIADAVRGFLEEKGVHEGEYEETLLDTLIDWAGL